MPLFVTHLVHSRHAPAWTRTPGAPTADAERDAHGYRRRLARLRTPAPDTLRDRVRRELRAAAGAAAARPE